MALPLIIARSFRDAHAFAKDKLGLRVGHYRVVNSPGTIKATRGANVYLVPGWDKGPGHFAMQTALRYCHHNIIDGSTVGVEETSEPTEPDETIPDPPADAFSCSQCEYTSDEYGDTHTHDETEQILSDPEAMAAIEEAEAQVTQDDEPEQPADPFEKPKARRRSRCKDCEQLHYKDEPCPTGGE